VGDVDTNAELHGKCKVESEIPNTVVGADVEGCGDGGATDECREPMKEKDARKERIAACTTEMEGTVLVQDAHVNVGDADVGTTEVASEGVAQGGTGTKR